jgi:hypothetical protein
MEGMCGSASIRIPDARKGSRAGWSSLKSAAGITRAVQRFLLKNGSEDEFFDHKRSNMATKL